MAEKEYIDKNNFLKMTEAFCELYDTNWHDIKVLAWIRNAPAADVVEVVRCKDCSWFRNADEIIGRCITHNRDIYADDFCSYGEKKEV